MVPSTTVTALLHALGRLGLDERSLPAAVEAFDGVVPDEAFDALWNAARSRWPTDDLELAVAGGLQTGAFGPFELSVLTAATVGDACMVFAQTLGAIVGGGTVLTLAPRPRGGMTVRLVAVPAVSAEGTDALLLAALVARLRQQTHPPLAPVGAWLTRPAPAARAPWDRFFGCRVRFAAPFTQVHLNGGDWRAPLASSNVAAHRALAPLLPGPGGELVEAVRAHVLQNLSLDQSLSRVARQLGVSARTLQRRLADARVSLRGLVAQTRVEEARRLLAGGRRTLGEVAVQVGLSSASSLARALGRAGAGPAER